MTPSAVDGTRQAPPEKRMRDAILGVALDRFARDGYDATSTRDICDDLNLARSGLYHYFRSKEEILFAIIDSDAVVMAQGRARVAAECAGLPPDLQLAQQIRYRTLTAIKYQKNHQILSQEMRSLTPEHYERLSAHSDGSRRELMSILQAGAEAGFWPHTDLRLHLATIWEILKSTWYRAGGNFSPSDVANFHVRYTLQALGRTPEQIAAMQLPPEPQVP